MTTPTDHSRPFAYRFVVALIRPLLMVLTRRQWSGAEHLRAEGGFIVVTNHYSSLDPFVFGHFLVDHGYYPRFLGKVEVFRVPVVGRILRRADQIPVHRESDRASDAYLDAVEAVRVGKTVAISPEGTLTRDPALWPMRGRTGAARVALKTRCPVVPIATWGSHEVLAPYARMVRPLPRQTTRVLAGQPVRLDDLHGLPITHEVLAQATTRIMATVTAELEILRGEAAPLDRFDPRAHRVAPMGKPRPLKEAS